MGRRAPHAPIAVVDAARAAAAAGGPPRPPRRRHPGRVRRVVAVAAGHRRGRRQLLQPVPRGVPVAVRGEAADARRRPRQRRLRRRRAAGRGRDVRHPARGAPPHVCGVRGAPRPHHVSRIDDIVAILAAMDRLLRGFPATALRHAAAGARSGSEAGPCPRRRTSSRSPRHAHGPVLAGTGRCVRADGYVPPAQSGRIHRAVCQLVAATHRGVLSRRRTPKQKKCSGSYGVPPRDVLGPSAAAPAHRRAAAPP